MITTVNNDLGRGKDAVTDMLNWLNLTVEEEAMIEDSDDEGLQEVILEWSLIGKVLSPKPIHSSTILKTICSRFDGQVEKPRNSTP